MLIKTYLYQIVNEYGKPCDITDFRDYGLFVTREGAQSQINVWIENEMWGATKFTVKEYLVVSNEKILIP